MRLDIINLSTSILASAIMVSCTINRLRVTVRRSILILRDEFRSLRKTSGEIDRC